MERLAPVIEHQGRPQVTRRLQLSRLAGALRSGDYVAISAGPQSGMTTFLQQCRTHLGSAPGLMGRDIILIQDPRWHQSPMAHVAAHIAEERRGPVKDAAGRLRRLARTERERGAEAMFESALGPTGVNGAMGVNGANGANGAKGSGVVVFIDNVHRMDVNTQRQLFNDARRLRELGARSAVLGRVLLVVAGVIEWDRLDPERVSPFSNAATKLTLPDLTPEEVTHLLMQGNGDPPPDVRAIARHLHAQTHGHPYFVARVAHLLGPVGSARFALRAVDEALVGVVTDGDAHLQRMREWLLALSDAERRPLTDILQGRPVRRSQLMRNPALERLLAHGILRCDQGNHVQFRNPLYARFVRSDALLRRQAFNDHPIAPQNIVVENIGPSTVDAFLRVSRLENRLRNFIAIRLYTEHGEAWVERGLERIETTPERVQGQTRRTLGSVLRMRRQVEEAEFLGPVAEEPLLAYAHLKELEMIVIKNWPLFKKPVPAQDRFKVDITKLTRVRNRLAHCRRLYPDDLERLADIESSFRGWLPDS